MDMADPAPDHLDALVAGHRQGDAAAFAAIIEVTQRQLRSCIATRIWSMEAVDELVQDTYVEAFEHLDRYTGDGRFLAWLLGIGRNLSRAWLERRQREQGRRAEIFSDLAANLPAVATDERAVDEDIQRLRQCLERLPAPMRSLVDRFYRDGWSLARLAKQAGATAGTLAVVLFRARKSLRSCMDRQVAP